MDRVWVLVCDAARGRLFETHGPAAKLRLLHEFAHPQSRAKVNQLVSDHSGNRSAEGASVHHNAMAPSTNPREVEKEHFAHEMVEHLDQALRANQFDRLVLVAPPQLLGTLRSELKQQLQNHLLATVDKDYVHLDETTLAERLREAVRIPLSAQGDSRPHGSPNHR
ncbi:MAG: host attachment family protein [Polyangiales bacterium]